VHPLDKEEPSTRFTYEALTKRHKRKRSSSNGNKSNHSSQRSNVFSNKIATKQSNGSRSSKRDDEKLFTTVRNTAVPKNIGTTISTGSSKRPTIQELATKELHLSDESLQQVGNTSYLNDHQFLLSDGGGKNSTTDDIYIKY